jgi:hypothetical protein
LSRKWTIIKNKKLIYVKLWKKIKIESKVNNGLIESLIHLDHYRIITRCLSQLKKELENIVDNQRTIAVLQAE